MKRRNFLVVYAVLWMVVIGMILFRFNPFFSSSWAAPTGRGAAVMGFMIFFGPLFFILYLMTGFLIDVPEPYFTVGHIKGFMQKRRNHMGLFLLALILFVLLNWI